jgi:hypothetical protein
MSWLSSLDRKNKIYEENLDVGSLDWQEVILKYRTAESEARSLRLRRRKKTEKTRHTSCGSRTRKGGKTPANRRGESPEKEATILDGIPAWANAQEYIKYRKCLLLGTVNEWRDQLTSALSPPVLDELQLLVNRLFK